MSTPVSRSAQPKASRGMPGIARRLLGNQAAKEDDVRSCDDDPTQPVVRRRAALIAVSAMVFGGFASYNVLISKPAAADTQSEIKKVFRWDSAPKCYIYPDVRTCGHVGGVTTVTLQGMPDSKQFLLTFSGEFQPQTSSGMNGQEKIYVVPKNGVALDYDVSLGNAHKGPSNFFVNETRDVNSRFMLKDITDVVIRIDG